MVMLLAGCDALFHIDTVADAQRGDALGDAVGGEALADAPTDRFVQVNAVFEPATVTTLIVPYLQAEQPQDLNVVIVGYDGTTGPLISVSDNVGNTYKVAAAPRASSSIAQAMYYAANVTGGMTHVTVTASFATANLDVRLLEYTAVESLNAVDASVGMVGAGSMVTSGTIMTGHANDLLVAGATVQTTVSQPDPTYRSRGITPISGALAEDQDVTVAGSYSATATQDSTGYWVMQLVAFKGT